MKNGSNPLVCFFDSGIGGLSLLCECVRRLPQVDFTYFADNFCVPYGNLCRKELIDKVDGIFGQINALAPAAAVVACNTVTAECIDFLRGKYRFEIIGIQPALKPALNAQGKNLVLATVATAKSEAMKTLLDNFGGGRTEVVACGELASAIENNIDNLTAEKITGFLPRKKADNVILGCTHYIFAKEIIKKFYNCRIFDGTEGTAERLCEKLGIFDHFAARRQKITFVGGDTVKNRAVFNGILTSRGLRSQNCD